MNRSDVIHALVLGAAVAASACARKEASGGTPAEDTAASAASTPAPWDPVDPQFKGCEGG